MIAVVIPCYLSAASVLPLIACIGEAVDHIIVVDDACPEETGRVVQRDCRDPRVDVVFHSAKCTAPYPGKRCEVSLETSGQFSKLYIIISSHIFCLFFFKVLYQ